MSGNEQIKLQKIMLLQLANDTVNNFFKSVAWLSKQCTPNFSKHFLIAMTNLLTQF